ncbi:MAG: tetratricopeptide repeat protein [Myxococcales bacterium]|nr:tetratricopeptide repeat protein [Myxococcales bacterium]
MATVRLGKYAVDLLERRATTPSGEQSLTPLEADLLAFLDRHRGKTMSRARLLTEVWGYSPSAVTRAVDNTVSRLRRKLELDPASPRWLVATRGGGYRLEPDEDAEDLRVTGNVPASRDAFVGRRKELAALGKALDKARLVTLLGPGGSGKTRLACEVALAHGGRFSGGVWLVDLSTATGDDGVLSAVAQAVKVPLRGKEPRQQLAHALAGRGPMLLVLDNVDLVVESVASLASTLLDAAPDLVLLATSREALRLRGEHRWPVRPLPLPKGDDAKSVSASDAADLFLKRAQARTSLSCTDATAPTIARIVRCLDGLPLALELAAAQVDRASLDALATELQTRVDGLVSDERDRPGRHHSVMAALQWAWDRLEAREQLALAQLSAFEGGFTEAAARTVLEPTLADHLPALTDRSLLVSGTERCSLLGIVRAFARSTLDAQSHDAVVRRHGAFFASLWPEAEAAVSGAQDGGEVRRVLTADLDNLVSACLRAVARADHATAVPCLAAAWEVLRFAGPVTAIIPLAEDVLAITGLHDAQELVVRRILADATKVHGPIETSLSHARQCVTLAQTVGDVREEAYARIGVGGLHWQQGELNDAEAHYRTALEQSRAHGIHVSIASALCNLAQIFEARGDLPSAIDHHEQALAVATDNGLDQSATFTASMLAVTHARSGAFQRARALFELALTHARDMGDRLLEASVMGNFGRLQFDMGDADSAVPLLEASLAIHTEVGNRRSVGMMHGTLGEVHIESGRVRVGHRHLLACVAIAHESGDRYRAAAWKGWLAYSFALKGEPQSSDRNATEAIEALHDMEQWRDLAEVHVLHARALDQLGHRRAAREALDEARRTAERAGLGETSVLGRQIARTAATLDR